jgi:hypothetical protein
LCYVGTVGVLVYLDTVMFSSCDFESCYI